MFPVQVWSRYPEGIVALDHLLFCRVLCLCLFLRSWSDSHPKSAKSFSKLQSLVAPVIIRTASMCTASSYFLLSAEALSHTESLYSRSGLMYEKYIFSRECLLSLNFRINLLQALVAILLMCSFQLHM